MPLLVNFTTSQILGLSNKVTLTDTTTGTDSPLLVVSRRVYFTDKDGVYYTEDGASDTAAYEVWVDFPATTTKTLAVLTQDRALNVRVDWVDAGGAVIYTKTILQAYTLYAMTTYINSIKAQSSNNSLKTHANFYQTLIKLLVSIKEANDSVTLLGDISSSQAALNRAKKIVDSPSYFY